MINFFENITEFDEILEKMHTYQDNIISKLRDDILKGEYEIYPDKVAERILLKGIYTIKFSKIWNS
ncbi:MAG: hypothetical protein ACPL7B_17900 [Candidatus Poribacteria bacterium]